MLMITGNTTSADAPDPLTRPRQKPPVHVGGLDGTGSKSISHLSKQGFFCTKDEVYWEIWQIEPESKRSEVCVAYLKARTNSWRAFIAALRLFATGVDTGARL
jgi:hypothetical protein